MATARVLSPTLLPQFLNIQPVGSDSNDKKITFKEFRRVIDQVKQLYHPKVVIVIGGSGCGKSHYTDYILKKDALKEDPRKYYVIDADKEKANVNPRINRQRHPASLDLAQKELNLRVENRENLIINATGRNRKHNLKLIESLKDSDYQVKLVLIKAPLDIAVARVSKRRGQHVPPGQVKKSNTAPTTLFKSYKKVVHSWKVFQNPEDGVSVDKWSFESSKD